MECSSESIHFWTVFLIEFISKEKHLRTVKLVMLKKNLIKLKDMQDMKIQNLYIEIETIEEESATLSKIIGSVCIYLT